MQYILGYWEPIFLFHLVKTSCFCVFASFNRKLAFAFMCTYVRWRETGSIKLSFTERWRDSWLRATSLFYACVAPVGKIPPRLQHQHWLFKNWCPWQHQIAKARGQRDAGRERGEPAGGKKGEKGAVNWEPVTQMMPSSSVCWRVERDADTQASLLGHRMKHSLACWAWACCHVKGKG